MSQVSHGTSQVRVEVLSSLESIKYSPIVIDIDQALVGDAFEEGFVIGDRLKIITDPAAVSSVKPSDTSITFDFCWQLKFDESVDEEH